MREIEFRAWTKKQRIMRDNVSFHDGNIWTGYAWVPFNANCELMQYTGKQDKNGVKIFEGDILKRSYELYTSNGIKQIIEKCVVEFDEETLRYIFSSFDTDIKLRFNENIEVIGNVFENGDLLYEN